MCSLRSITVGFIAVVALVLGSPSLTLAQSPVSWSIRSPEAEVEAGLALSITLSAEIAPGWKVYSLTQGRGGPTPMRVSLKRDQPFSLAGVVRAPMPVIEFDPNFQIEVEVYQGKPEFNVPVRVAKEAPAGEQSATITVNYQACDANACLPPQSVDLPVQVRITSSGKE